MKFLIHNIGDIVNLDLGGDGLTLVKCKITDEFIIEKIDEDMQMYDLEVLEDYNFGQYSQGVFGVGKICLTVRWSAKHTTK